MTQAVMTPAEITQAEESETSTVRGACAIASCRRATPCKAKALQCHVAKLNELTIDHAYMRMCNVYYWSCDYIILLNRTRTELQLARI